MYKHVDKIFSCIETGSTTPFLCEIEGQQCYLKAYNNPESNRTLVNELVSYRIAIKLGLLMPESGICIVDKDTQIDSSLNFSEDNWGLGFYSVRIDKVTVINNAKLIQQFAHNKEIIPRIILF